MVTRIGLASAKPIRTYFIEWREWKGWTQQELADRLETTVATVSRVENGARDWGKGYLEAFAHVIGCPNPTDPISRPPGAPITLDDMLKGASPEVRKQAIAVVETLLRTGTNG
jgi:transcriptional regulator with XRE-family HTH domain